jgi:hypothetical protein
MTLRQRRSYIAVVISLLAIVAAAALAASGLAGSASVTFTGVTLPETLKIGNQGSVKGEVTAPKGITHGLMTITLASGMNAQPPFGCNGCTRAGNVFTFDFSLAAGKTFAAFVTYQTTSDAGQANLGTWPVEFSLAWDNGKQGPGGTDGPLAVTPSPTVTIVAANAQDADGKCSNISGGQTDSVFTLQDLNINTNKQSTKLVFGPAARSPLGYTYPCTGVFVLEKGPFPGSGRSERSVFNSSTFASLATLIVRFVGYTQPLSLTVYSDPDDITTGTPVQNCPSPTTMASGQKVCLVGWQKNGNVMTATLLYAGGDPGLDGV